MRHRRLPPTLLVLALALGACSGGADGDDVASLTGADPAADTAAGADPAGEFVRCLRDEGVDASLGESGSVHIGSGHESSIAASEDGEITEFSVGGVDYTEPVRVCQERVPGYDPFAFDPDAPELAELQEHALAWVACVREQGLTGIEDPEHGAVLLPDHLTPTTLAGALEACPLRDHPFGGVGFDGEPDPEVLALLNGAW